ncbi:hypothetical protein H6G17_29395 [Chroococcidiopsis sp. FACHB-1243]|uniref:hypothetical protein n=1 Tax=Chroococcidiopsis sp. [FACHB-1243] TaxID=2692781 RepID=UPI0017821F93|nr:hypothetical protein [Chroococcidiopsis sp. [FACHB-1243]]MBD2309558.1 hypothetical protein [Chroococcidiopsis sp. [FACHB-1243]]
MPKFKLSALISAICLVSIVLYVLAGFSQVAQPKVRLTTEPGVNPIFPFEAEATKPQSPALLKLQVLDASGQPLENVKIGLTIFTPPKNPWFTTDFPIVEGTKLLEMAAVAPKGKLQIQQMLPIRGTYQLLVNVTPTLENAFSPFKQTLTLTVPENWLKYRNLGILVAILLIVGVVGGLAIGERQQLQSGEIAPQRVRLLLSGAIVVAIAALLFVNVSAEIAQSGMSMPMSHMSEPAPSSEQPSTIQSGGLQLRLSGDVSATVGQPANFQVNVIDPKTSQPVADVFLKIQATQLEDNWLAFAYQGTADATGQLKWQQQFFDGAPHKFEVEVSPQANAARQFQPFQVVKTIPVEGVAPPLSVRSIVLAYLTGVVIVGLLLGIWLRRNRVKPVRQIGKINAN